MTETDVIEEFRAAMAAAGIEPPDDIVADGLWHHFHLPDEKNGKQSGVYIAFDDDFPYIEFGDWRIHSPGEWLHWHRKISHTLTPEEDRRIRERRAEAKRQRDAKRSEKYRRGAAAAAKMWAGATPAVAQFPYLVKKGVLPHGLRMGRSKYPTEDWKTEEYRGRVLECLFVPVRKPSGDIAGLQRIWADGKKAFIYGTDPKGNYFIIGEFSEGPIVIAEGFATGATIHEVTGHGVAVAFDAGNLEPVARTIRKTHPETPIILAADNDRFTTDNPGVTKATAAAEAVGGVVIVPDFGDSDSGTDFNDLAAQCGIEAVRAAFAAAEPKKPPAPLSNYILDKDSNTGKQITRRIAAPVISRLLFRYANNWPRRVDRTLFVDEAGAIRWLENQHDLFAWLDERFQVRWKSGDKLAKTELYSHLLACGQGYDGVEVLPHEPQLSGLYYNWTPPRDYTPDGSHLDKLVGFFQNTETAGDRDFIKAMLCTPAWGGPHGTRPAGIIQAADRGSGKTTLAEVIGAVYGGIIAVDPGERGEDRLVSRLLTLSARTRRVVLVDNLKGLKSSALIEGLITGQVVSGHMLHVGNAERPNTLTWLFTGNTIQFSRDLADRAFIIHLTKPKPQPGWRENVLGYVEAYRDRLLADIVALLQSPAKCTGSRDRWQSWVDAVLSRVTPHATTLVELNQERRDAVDTELDEAGQILDEVHHHIKTCNPADRFISSTTITKLVNEALGVHFSTRKVVAVVKGHIEAGRLNGVTHDRKTGARGFYVT